MPSLTALLLDKHFIVTTIASPAQGSLGLAGLRTVAPVQLQTPLAGNTATLLAGQLTHEEVMEMSGWNMPSEQAGGEGGIT